MRYKYLAVPVIRQAWVQLARISAGTEAKKDDRLNFAEISNINYLGLANISRNKKFSSGVIRTPDNFRIKGCQRGLPDG